MKTKLFTFIFSLVALTGFIAPQASFAASGQWKQGQDSGMNFWVYLPAHHVARPGLMINLHGCAPRAVNLKELGNWEAAAEQFGMVVVLPDAPNGGVLMGCWDYYGAKHSDTNRHNGPLVSLAQNLIKNETLNIDPDKVFVSGLSSGATQAMVVGCLRPDIFRGVGISSGPALGTGMTDLQNPRATAQQVAGLCKQLAGNHADAFAKQMTSIIVSDQDPIVSTRHAVINAEAMSVLYEVKSQVALDLTKLKGANTKGRGAVYLDTNSTPRLALIVNDGIGHAWPAGNGTSARSLSTISFITPNSIDYPHFLAKMFHQGALQEQARLRRRANQRVR